MLQGMERHNGIFICTTNLLDSIDPTIFSSDEFMSQLEARHRIKPEVREARSMGFMQ